MVLIPRALALSSPSQLRAANLELEKEISERRRVEEELLRVRDELDLRVQQRTLDLAATNEELKAEIAERKRAEERFRLVVEAAPNAIVMINLESKIMLVNSQVEAVFGYTRQELIGSPIEILVPERFRERRPGYLQRYIAGPEGGAMGAWREFLGQRKDGSEVPIEVRLCPIQSPEGSVPFWLRSSTSPNAGRRN